jgi:hypothetical protein
VPGLVCAGISAAFFDQAMLVPDALERVMSDTQIEFANEAAGPEGGQSFAEFHELRFAGERSLVRLVVPCAGLFAQPGIALLLETTQPLAHRGHGGGEKPGRRFNAALSGTFTSRRRWL